MKPQLSAVIHPTLRVMRGEQGEFYVLEERAGRTKHNHIFTVNGFVPAKIKRDVARAHSRRHSKTSARV